MTEEQTQNLIEAPEAPKTPENENLDEESVSDNQSEQAPPSSRAKKVLKWNKKELKFEIEEAELAKLRDFFKKDTQMREFENMYKEFNSEIHPQVKGIDKLMAAGLWSAAVVFLLAPLFYVGLIIFQLALYNVILGVVMVVYWLKALRAVRSVIWHKLD